MSLYFLDIILLPSCKKKQALQVNKQHSCEDVNRTIKLFSRGSRRSMQENKRTKDSVVGGSRAFESHVFPIRARILSL